MKGTRTVYIWCNKCNLYHNIKYFSFDDYKAFKIFIISIIFLQFGNFFFKHCWRKERIMASNQFPRILHKTRKGKKIWSNSKYLSALIYSKSSNKKYSGICINKVLLRMSRVKFTNRFQLFLQIFFLKLLGRYSHDSNTSPVFKW